MVLPNRRLLEEGLSLVTELLPSIDRTGRVIVGQRIEGDAAVISLGRPHDEVQAEFWITPREGDEECEAELVWCEDEFRHFYLVRPPRWPEAVPFLEYQSTERN